MTPVMTPEITVADLHAGTHRYTLVFDNASRKINERYIRLYHYRPGQDTRIVSFPTTIAMLLSYAKKSYGLHACSHAGVCPKSEPSELNTNIVTIARDQGYCLECRRETGNCVCSKDDEQVQYDYESYIQAKEDARYEPAPVEPVHAF